MGLAHEHTTHLIETDEPDLRAARARILWLVLGLNGSFLFAELIGGFVFGSLALLADAAHMLSDVAAISIALVAHALMAKPRTERHTFGLLRAEALGAQASAVLLVSSTAWIVAEAAGRIGEPRAIAGRGLLIVATLGLVVNVVSAVLLMRVRGRDLAIDGAFFHMVADAAGSVSAIAAGVAVITAGATWVDTASSLLIAAMVLVGAWSLLRRSTRILMEAVPRDIDPAAVTAAMAAQPGIESVHHLHLWSLSSNTAALSAHVVLEGELYLHEAQERGAELRHMLAHDFGITHATLDLECHMCEDEPAGHARGAGHA